MREALIAEQEVKLTEAYEDYLAINETVIELRKEAKHGSGKLQEDNKTLTENMEAIQEEYQKVASVVEQATKQAKDFDRELRFHRDLLSEARGEADTSKAELEECKSRLEIVEHNLDSAMFSNAHLLEEKTRLTVLTDDLNSKAEQVKKQHEAKLKLVNTKYNEEKAEVQRLTQTKVRLEGECASLQTANLQNIREKAEAQELARHHQQLAQKESAARSLISTQLNDLESRSKANEARLFEEREQLLSQIHDAKQRIEEEETANETLRGDIGRLKAEAARAQEIANDQIAKLGMQKNTLAADKAALTEHARNLKTQLNEQDEEIARLTNHYEKERAAHTHTRETLSLNLADLKALHGAALADSMTHQATIKTMEAEQSQLKTTLQLKNRDISDLKSTLKAKDETIAELTSLRVNLEATLKDRENEILALRANVKDLQADLAVAERLRQETALLHQKAIEARQESILALMQRLASCQIEFKRQLALRQELVNRLQTSSVEVHRLKTNLATQESSKAMLESRLDQMQADLFQEAEQRAMAEKVDRRIVRITMETHAEACEMLENRSKRLDTITEMMERDAARLRAFQSILPSGLTASTN